MPFGLTEVMLFGLTEVVPLMASEKGRKMKKTATESLQKINDYDTARIWEASKVMWSFEQLS